MEDWICMIFIIPGVLSRDWSVIFEDQCALKGTSVVMKCSYDYPRIHFVTNVEWSRLHQVSGVGRLTPLSRLPSPPHHFKYVGNYRGNCDLEINDVQQTDEGQYYFTFVTSLDRWRSQTPAQLHVKELTAAVQPSTVTEGDNVRLTCRSGCSTTIAIMWFRDGKRVLTSVFLAGIEDAGRYYCAVPGQEKVRSASVPLTVHYAPRKVTLSASPSGNVAVGSSVTFTCSSDAKPPVTYNGYSLYMEGRFISSGQNHKIADLQPGHSGLYHCQAWNSISRSGVDLINSTRILLDVKYGPMNISIEVDPQQVTEGSSVNLTCSGAANPQVDSYTWYMRANSPSSSSMTRVGSGQLLSLPSMGASHVGLYICSAWNSVGENNSTEILLTMMREDRGSLSEPIIAVVGVVALVALVTALLVLWKKQRTYAKEKIALGSTLRVGSVSSSVKEDQAETIYANIHTSLPRKGASHRVHDVATYDEAEVTYSTVTVTPRNNSEAPEETWAKTAEKNSSVIYATVATTGP